MTRRTTFLSRLFQDRSGVAITEAALILPFFLGAGLWGIELANYSLVTMRVGQLAAHVADNASRIGDISTLENRKIYESDINDLLKGAALQAGTQMDIYDHGRVIISSLEVNGDGAQYIHWQRCMGKYNVPSSFGKQGDVLTDGMGKDGQKVYASDGDAVIFVELQYEYQPLISASFVSKVPIRSVASFTVRSSRDLSQIYQVNPAAPDPPYTCDKFENAFA
ncbi:MAG: pilus assembly protein [Novosphingobium sp.]